METPLSSRSFHTPPGQRNIGLHAIGLTRYSGLHGLGLASAIAAYTGSDSTIAESSPCNWLLA